MDGRHAGFLMNFLSKKTHYPELEEPFLDGLLIGAAIEPQVDKDKFARAVLRLHRVGSVKRSILYWSPAIAGASIAAMALLALLQMLTSSSSMKPIRILNGDAAQRMEQPSVQLPEGPAMPIVR